MGGHHHHDHHQHDSQKNFKIAFFLNLGFTIFEIIGGLYVNSVAILSDAVHDLGDSLSIGTAWYLDKKSKKGANEKYSYGYARFSLLGALINCVVLLIGSLYIGREALERILHPEATNAEGMFYFALVGLVVNGYAAWKMSRGNSLNEKVISWHLIEDVLGWGAILIGSIILFFYDSPYIDPILSLLIMLYILYHVVHKLRQTLFLFLQGTPSKAHVGSIKNKLLKIEHVQSLHAVHIWSLDGHNHVFTAHIVLEHISTFDRLKEVRQQIKNVLAPNQFQHLTIETELDPSSCSLNKNQ